MAAFASSRALLVGLAMLVVAGCQPRGLAPAAPIKSTTASPGCVAPDPRIGSKAFAFALPGIDGGTHSFPGAEPATLVAFWASWCEPCQEELVAYQGLATRLEAERVGFTLVSTDADRAVASSALGRFAVDMPSAYAGEDEFNRYLQPTLPWTMLVDSSGYIRSVHQGFDPDCISALELELRALALEPAPR